MIHWESGESGESGEEESGEEESGRSLKMGLHSYEVGLK